jgi:hypothetical protein
LDSSRELRRAIAASSEPGAWYAKGAGFIYKRG